MKSIINNIIIILIFIFNIKFNNAAILYPLVQSQNVTAIDMCKNLFLYQVDLEYFEICGTTVFSCNPSNEEPGFYSIIAIDFRDVENVITVPKEVTQDLSVFTDLGSIDSVNKFIFGSTFFNSLSSLSKLRTLGIANQSLEIPVTTTFPPLISSIYFGEISVPLPIGFFESSSLYSLNVQETFQGFSLPTLTKVNDVLQILIIPITSITTISSDMGNYLKNIYTLELNVYNDVSLLALPDLSSFKSLATLRVNFFNGRAEGTYSTFPYPQSIVNLPITLLSFSGYGFIIDSSLGKFDLSNMNKPIELNFNLGGESISGIVLPKGSQFKTINSDYDFSLVDYSNLIYFSSYNNEFDQTLPIINYPTSLDTFEITGSDAYGSIPQSYCQFKELDLSNNKNLEGPIPTCFTCLGGNDSAILPNNFIDFNISSPPKCPDFKVNIQDVFILPTNGGNITLTGVNLGWHIDISNSLFNINIDVVIPNEKIVLIIPPGTGYGFKPHVNFKNGIEQILKINYAAPLINYYTIGSDNGNIVIIIHGEGFDYQSFNYLTSNGDIIFNGLLINGTIIVDDIEWTVGSKQELFIKVGNDETGIQTSNKTIYYYPDIQISNEQINIFDSTGSVLINGSFVNVIDSSLVKVTINNINCIVNSISSTSISITYPSLSTLGNNDMSINIGGNNLFTTVNIIKSPTPSPTLPNQTSDSNSDDQPSESSNLSISLLFNILIIIFISSSLLLL